MSRRFVAALALCGLSLTAAACGDSAEDDDGAATATTEEEADTTSTTNTLPDRPLGDVWTSVDTAVGDPEWCGPMVGYREYVVDAMGAPPEPGDAGVFETNARAAEETAATPGLPQEYIDSLATVAEANRTAAALAAGEIEEITPEQQAMGEESMQVFEMVGQAVEQCPATVAAAEGVEG